MRPVERTGMLSRGGDGEIPDVVGLDTRAAPKCGFDRALAGCIAHRDNGIFEGSLRNRTCRTKLFDLVLILNEPRFRKVRRQLVVVRKRRIDGGIQTAQRTNARTGSLQFLQILSKLVEWMTCLNAVVA